MDIQFDSEEQSIRGTAAWRSGWTATVEECSVGPGETEGNNPLYYHRQHQKKPEMQRYHVNQSQLLQTACCKVLSHFCGVHVMQAEA